MKANKPDQYNKEFPKKQDKAKDTEVKMISQIGKVLKEKFGEDNILQQGAKVKKLH